MTFRITQRTFMKYDYRAPKSEAVRDRNLDELQVLHNNNSDYPNDTKVKILLKKTKPGKDYWRKVNNHILALRIFEARKKRLAVDASED